MYFLNSKSGQLTCFLHINIDSPADWQVWKVWFILLLLPSSQIKLSCCEIRDRASAVDSFISGVCRCWPANLHKKAVFIVIQLPYSQSTDRTAVTELFCCSVLICCCCRDETIQTKLDLKNDSCILYRLITLDWSCVLVILQKKKKKCFVCFFFFSQALCLDRVPWHTKLCTKLHKWAWASHSALVSYRWPVAYWI